MDRRVTGSLERPHESAYVDLSDTPYLSEGGELPLSNHGQLELLQAVLGRDASLRVTMRGHSMAPCVRDRDVVTVAPVIQTRLSVGDIVAVTLPSSGRLVVHRIVARAGEGWLVRGDGCAGPDGVVDADDILGRVTRVERSGRRVVAGVAIGRKGYANLSRMNVLMLVNRSLSRMRRIRGALTRTMTKGSRNQTER